MHEIPKRTVDFAESGGDSLMSSRMEMRRARISSSATDCSSARRASVSTECLKAGFDGFAADGHSVEQTLAVEVFDGRDARGVGLSLQVSPLDQLAQRLLNGFEAWRPAGPVGFGEHIVGAKVKAELALGARRRRGWRGTWRVLRYYVAEESGRGARKPVRRHCPILAGWRGTPLKENWEK